MKIKLISAVMIAFIIATIACKNDDNDSIREKLTNKNWKITKGGLDANANGIPDGNELQPVDSALLANGILNDNGSGSVTFSTNDTSGTAAFTWTLDASNTYINITIPALSSNTVSKILSVNTNSLTVVVDTSASVKLFAYFEKQ